jgi:hypothetical protein
MAAVGLCGLGLAAALPVGPGMAATRLPSEAGALLSEDGFGVCVPEENLDAIWLALARFGKSGRVPHVCMSGGCDDLPGIAEWAAAQQYPEDTDLERDDVQARYGAFVAEYCGPEDDPQPAEAPPAEAPPVEDTPEAEVPPLAPPLFDLALPPLFTPPGFNPPRSAPPTGSPPLGSPPGGTPRFPELLDPLPPRGGDPRPPGHPPADPPAHPPHPPVPHVPLPAGLWLLLSALGLGLAFGGRRDG